MDLNILTTIQMLCSDALSICVEMCGRDDIVLLTWKQFDLEYRAERRNCKGMQTVKINHLINKRCNLTMNNLYTRDGEVDFYMVKTQTMFKIYKHLLRICKD